MTKYSQNHPQILDALNSIKDMQEKHAKELITAITRKKIVIRDPQTNKIIGVE
jgi:hypothetical protein